MPEMRRYEVETTVNITCPSGDGGLLIYLQDPAKDDQEARTFTHRCSESSDLALYKLAARYPYREWQALNIDIVPGLKVP